MAGIAPISAQTSTLARNAIPDTPAGEQLEWALEQVNNGGTGLTERRIEDRFAPTFLAGLSAAQLIDVFRLYVGPAGPMDVARFEGGVTDERANALLTTPAGLWRVTLSVEPGDPYRINQLYFEPAYPPPSTATPVTSWSSLKDQYATLAPQTSFIAAELNGEGCTPLARVNADDQLAIASSFKVYVLGELAQQIEQGLATWDEPLPIDSSLISLPNGEMRYQPPGEAFPLAYYADQMIAFSDNTATDHLIARLGRQEVEQSFATMGHAHPELNTPLLMTREWFAIKMRFSDRDIRRYKLAGENTRREIIQTMAIPNANTLAEWEPWLAFRAIDTIEWFASAADLCDAMASLHSIGQQEDMAPVLNALSLQPGITFDPADWSYVGYKGGYETGVRSDVWLLQRNDGRWFVLAGIVNNYQAEIDHYGHTNLMIAAADLLARAE
jgi:beta-lactamase class A